MKIMTKVEIVWSIHVFFFKPAKIPKAIPRGTESKTAMILTENETGNLSKIILIALLFGSITVDLPQSHLVTMFFNQTVYCSKIGLT